VVVTGRGALVVPDEQSLTIWGADPAAEGLEPAFEPRSVTEILAPEHVPEVLADALAEYREQLYPGVSTQTFIAPVEPRTLAAEHDTAQHDVSGQGDHEDHGGHRDHGDHGDHGDMMEIVGEPSADGLVMESIDVSFGPLGTPLPGGLLVSATLDGDVVADGSVRGLLVQAPGDGTPAPPDPICPVAWNAAIGGDGGWRRVVDVELERAISHLAWLRSLARLLGWNRPIGACSTALSSLLAARSDDVLVPNAQAKVAAAADCFAASRALRLRLRDVASVSADHVRNAGLRGPVARASGVHDDARNDDPRYGELGFEPVLRSEGDALARTLLRADEAKASLELAMAAQSAITDPVPAAGPVIEAPRGPVSARKENGEWQFDAPGATEAAAAAGAAMAGLEWGAALIAVASFDLSAWRLAG